MAARDAKAADIDVRRVQVGGGTRAASELSLMPCGTSGRTGPAHSQRTLWKTADVASAPPTVPYEAVMASDDGVLAWLQAIVRGTG